MAVKLGFEAIQYVLKKVLTKKGIKGIATIPGKAYDMRMKQLVDAMAFKMKALGYDINKVTQKEVQGLLDSAEALAKQKPTPESLIKGKKHTEVPPFQGWNPKVVKTTKKDRPSMRLIKNFDQELDDITLAKEGYNLQEIDILKRARNVMKKEGQNPDDALSWVRSEMADDAGIDFEDFMTEFDWGDFPGKAEGGRIGFGPGGLAKGAKWFINSLKKNLTDMEAGHPRFKVVPAKDQETLKVGYRTFIKELEAGEEVPIEALEAISKNPQYFKTKKATRSQDPDLAEVEELIDAKVFGDVRQELKDFEVVGRKPQQSGGLAYMLGEPTYMKADGGRIGLKKGSESWRQKLTRWAGGTSALAGELGLEGIHQMQSLLGLGGLYSGGGSVGHAPWHKPTAQQQPQQQQQPPQPQGQPQPGGAQSPGRGQPNPMKGPRGLPSLAPRTMDPAFMQQQAMQKMMGQGQQPRMGRAEGGMTQEDFNQFLKEREEMYREGGKHELEKDWERYKRFKQYGKVGIQEAADGGRIGMMYGGDPGFQFEYGGSWADWRDHHQHQMPVTDYIKTKLPKERLPFRDMQSGGIARLPLGLGSMSRRAFLKMMATLGIGTAAAKSGISLLSKTVPKTIKAVETITRGADGMPKYISDLIEVVKAKGTKDFIEGFKKSDYSTVHTYKGVDVIEDGAGNIKIKSGKSGTATDSYTGKTHEGISQENHIQIEKGEYVKNKKGKMVKEGDEYIEGSVYPDMDGKMKDFEEGLDEAIHLDFKKIADEVDTLIIKKASGGRVPLGGGGILKVLKKITKKLKKIKKPEAYIMDKGYKLGKYYKKNPGKGLSHSTAVGTGVLISRHLDRQKRGKKASGGVAQLLGE